MSGLASGAQTIPQALAYWARQTPDAVALLSPERPPTTYRELHGAVECLASALRAVGLGRQDGIAVLVPEGPDLCVALLAATSVGIAVPLAWPGPLQAHRGVLAKSFVRAVLTSTEVPVSQALVGREIPIVTLSGQASGTARGIHSEGEPPGQKSPARPALAEDLALVLSSSGTTGRPKLVPRTHRAVVSTCETVIAARAKTRADRCLNLARLVYSQGFNALMYILFTGASLISVSSFGPGPGYGPGFAEMPGWVSTYRPTYLSTTPAVLQALAADRDGLVDAVRRSPLRFIHSTAGPLSPQQLTRLETLFGMPILNGYGMSEAPGIAAEPYPFASRVPGSVGPPLCEIRFVDETGRAVAAHRIGEIVVRGPRVFPGYLDDPEATAAAFLPGGWFRTGDLGYLDEGGMLHLTGRLSEVINRGGEKIAPGEVDDALLSHPALAEAAVFGVPDERLGEDIVAAIVPRPGAALTPRELRAWVRVRLTPYKVPRRIWEVQQIPRTPTGKVRRGELSRRWRQEHG